MKQSTIIFVTLLVAFVIYITIRGQLPAYFSLFTGANVGNVSKDNSDNKSNNGATGDWSNTLAEFDKLMSTMGLGK